jgi:phosphatidylserine/phosphatidylglycerophosphate/cardiolipin synthase-like enzyme
VRGVDADRSPAPLRLDLRGPGALADAPNFTLAALARSDVDPATGGWQQREIYTHAKLCVVDGAWATIGSANLVDLSLLPDHTELNAALWSPEVCTRLLCELVAEHCELREVDDVAALASFARVARASRRACEAVVRCWPAVMRWTPAATRRGRRRRARTGDPRRWAQAAAGPPA